jgi:hypothetical protein
MLFSMSEIFVSHAVADQPLASLFTKLLKEAIGVPSKSIFCSSVAGHGIPLGENFNDYMKNKIQKPKLVFLLMTPSYMESAFCLMELGAAWAQSSKTIPIVVPPVSFEQVTKTLGLIQALKIEDSEAGLNKLRQAVKSSGITLESRTDDDWDDKRKQWRKESRTAIKTLKGATKVAIEEHKQLQDERDKLKTEVAALEAQLDGATDTIDELCKTKDAAEVREVMRRKEGNGEIEAEFQELLNAVENAMPNAASVVKRHIVMDHYGKAGSIDWSNDRPEFETAIQRNLLTTEDYAVRWGSTKLSKLDKALRELDIFLDTEGKELASRLGDDVCVEADDIEFWKEHLSI